jgi:chromosomal replication initiation ATPase DnaA
MERTPTQKQSDFRGKPELTFDSFVTGDSNYVAYSAAAEVAERPGVKYNPLFIFCNVGQGKTHLLHAIGWDYLRRDPSGKVQLLNGDEFSEELADTHDRRALRDAYSQADLLLLDDFHLLTEQARLELIRLFETLQSGKKQLVLTSLRAPEELDMDDRLRSRIEGGLVCKILPPDVATRIGILRKKAEQAGVSIREGVLEDIARKVTANVRKLEGAINRLVVLSKARDEMISSDFVASALRDIIPEHPTEPAMTYEAPAEGGESEFTDFVSDVAKTMARISPEPSEEARLREAYAQKLYVWEMKGFVVDRLKAALDKKMDVLAREFVTFTSDVQRLIELQNRFGSLNAKRFPEEAAVIEKLLFDPSAVEDVRKRIDNLAVKLSAVSPDLIEDYTFARFVLGSPNEEAYRTVRSIAEMPHRGPDLVFIWGEEGVGKSHLINALTRELYEKQSRINIFLLHGELFAEDLKIERGRHARGKLRQRCLAADLLIVDDVHVIFENKYATDEFMTVLDQRMLDGLKVLLVSNRSPDKTSSDPGFARLIAEAKVVEISRPTDELKREIATGYLSRKIPDFSETDVEEALRSAGDNLWSLMDRLDQLVVKKRGRSLDLEGTTIVEEQAAYSGPPQGEKAVRDLAGPTETLPEVGVAEEPVVSVEESPAETEETQVEPVLGAESEIELIPISEAEEEVAGRLPDVDAAAPEALEEDVPSEPFGVEVQEEVRRETEPEDRGGEVWMPRPEAPPSIEGFEPGIEAGAPPSELEQEEGKAWERGQPAPSLDKVPGPSAGIEEEAEKTEAEPPGEEEPEGLDETGVAAEVILEGPDVLVPEEPSAEVQAEPSKEEILDIERGPEVLAEEEEGQEPVRTEAEVEVLPEETHGELTAPVEAETESREGDLEGMDLGTVTPEAPPAAGAVEETSRTEVEAVEERAEPAGEPDSAALTETPPAVEPILEPPVSAEEVAGVEEETGPTEGASEEAAAPTWERGRETPALEEIFAASPEEETERPDTSLAVEPEAESEKVTETVTVEAEAGKPEAQPPSAETELVRPEPVDEAAQEPPEVVGDIEKPEEQPPLAEEEVAPSLPGGEAYQEPVQEETPAEAEELEAHGPSVQPESAVSGEIEIEETEARPEEAPSEPAVEEVEQRSPRPVDEIMDTAWEIEGDRLIDSI